MFFDFLFPPQCVQCQKIGSWACDSCLQSLKISEEKRNINDSFDELLVFAEYESNPLIQKLIAKCKYLYAFDAIFSIQKPFQNFVESKKILKDAVISYVPLHWTRFFSRGFNQSFLIAKMIGKPEKLLKRIRATSQQAKLDKTNRIKNVENAFLFIGKNIPETVILVDDVASTCSTLNECAKVLKKAGVKTVYAVVLAHNFHKNSHQ